LIPPREPRSSAKSEVRVSKELLDGEIPHQDTIFFRAGHFWVPDSLPEALERSGYQFDSSFTADDVLSNFPFALPQGLGFDEDSEGERILPTVGKDKRARAAFVQPNPSSHTDPSNLSNYVEVPLESTL
jgi:hypothetical protein